MHPEILYILNRVLPELMQGLWISIQLIIPSVLVGIFMGVLSSTMAVFGHPLLKLLARSYVLLFRGFPLLIQLYIWYFGMPRLGIYLSPMTAAILGFSLCSGAYQSEYIRGALLSIKSGQLLAAYSLGLSRFKTIFWIILPQALRRALPGCSNEIIYLIKYSSLAYMVTCIELTGKGKILASASFKYTEVFLIVGVIYLIIVYFVSSLLSFLENRLAVPGFEK
ncbi:MAG: amino acid ABC transporter permease [Desulfohalobiaceae bacterium]|nr:amino acid ABC transporter permease [Desulfohalobiaceae bacterium]